MKNNWKDIHYSFNQELQQQWEQHGFTINHVRDWINIGLTPHDAHFVYWLEKEGHTALAVLNYEDLQVLRKEYDKSLINPKPPFNFPSKPNWKLIVSLILLAIIFCLFIS